jgi:CHAT domain-containing protein
MGLAIAAQILVLVGCGPLAEATALDRRAADLSAQGRYTEAEPLFKRALEIRERALGPVHPDVASSLNRLAELYNAQGRFAEAGPLLERALAMAEKPGSLNQSDLSQYLNNLGAVYWNQGRRPEAEGLVKRALAVAEKSTGSDYSDLVQSLKNLALFYMMQARYSEAEPLYKRALAILEKALPSDDPAVAQRINDLAGVYFIEERSAEAENLLQRALTIREKALGADHPAVAQSLDGLASIYWRQGRYAEGEPLSKRALGIEEKAFGSDSPEFARSLSNLAALYSASKRYEEAEALDNRALTIQEKALGPEDPRLAQSLNNLGQIYELEGRYAEAESLDRRALAIVEEAEGKDHPDVSWSLQFIAALYQTQSRYDEAEPLLKRAQTILEKVFGSDSGPVAENLAKLARIQWLQGRMDDALSTSARAVDVSAKHLSILSLQRSGAATAEQRKYRSHFVDYVLIADAAKAPERRLATATATFRVAQMAQTSSAGAAVAAMAARLAAGGGNRSAMTRERQDLLQRWEGLNSALIKSAGRPPADRQPGEEASLRAALKDEARRLDRLDERIAAEFPAYAELSNPKPLAGEEAQGLLAGDEAMLVYLVTDEATWLWVLRRDDLSFYRVDAGAQSLLDEVWTLRQRLDPYFNRELLPFPATRAYALFQKLVGPAEPKLAGVRRLLIVPDGALQSLHLGVLVTRPPRHDPKTPADHRKIAWLARDYAVTVLPSVSSLRGLRQFADADHAAAPFLGIGDPVLNGSPDERKPTLASLFPGAIGNVEKVRALPPLPETAEELRAIARTMGATEDDLLLRERASEPMLRQTPLDHYRVIAFATHALMTGALNGLAEPALVLTPPAEATAENDGLLTASKIATLKFNADWVVLSACNTAAGIGPPAEGALSGLAKAFFYAGARSLLLSHWAVKSDAAVRLTTGAFAELAKDSTIGRAEALRRSMMAMLDPANPPGFAHPLAWAPFVLAGEGGTRR